MNAANFPLDRKTNVIATVAALVAAALIFAPVVVALVGPFVG